MNPSLPKPTADPPQFLAGVVARCQVHLVEDPRVLGICLFGSLATGLADDHSDVDLGILVSQDQLDTILLDRRLITGVAPLLACGPAVDDPGCIFALHDIGGRLVKVDYNYFSAASRPSWLLPEVRVLYDPAGTIAELAHLPSRAPRTPEHQPDAFWIALSSAIRMLLRGELLEACDILNHLRDPLVTGLLSRAYQVPFRNYRRIEERFPPEIIARLKSTFARPESKEIQAAIVQLADLYKYAWRLVGENGDRERLSDRILESAEPG